MGKLVLGSSELCPLCLITQIRIPPVFYILCFKHVDLSVPWLWPSSFLPQRFCTYSPLSLECSFPTFPMAGSFMSLGISQMWPPQKSLLWHPSPIIQRSDSSLSYSFPPKVVYFLHSTSPHLQLLVYLFIVDVPPLESKLRESRTLSILFTTVFLTLRVVLGK